MALVGRRWASATSLAACLACPPELMVVALSGLFDRTVGCRHSDLVWRNPSQSGRPGVRGQSDSPESIYAKFFADILDIVKLIFYDYIRWGRRASSKDLVKKL